MSYTRERLGEVLVRAGLISDAQLLVALDQQQVRGGKLGEVLVQELIVTEDQLAEALAEQKDLTHVSLSASRIDPGAAVLLPLRMARKRLVIPIAIEADRLVLAMADPLDVEAIDEAEFVSGMKVEPVVAAASQVRYAIEKYIAGVDALQELELVDRDRAAETAPSDTADADADVAVVRAVNRIMHEAVAERSSDIHFEPAADSVRVRYRVDGVLREAASLPKSSQAELISRIKVMADLDITERRRPQDGRISIKVGDKILDLRVATLPTPHGESIVLRILDSGVSLQMLEDLGLADEDLVKVRRMLHEPYGALFVSGPTGSGKSTTMYALLNEINDVGRKIITIEDPVEYTMNGITQIAVNPRVGLTFAAGLRTVLRSDPDVVMVGEVRDPETAEIAVRGALTGHLVLSSIHTNDAPSALTRLTDMGVPPYITSSGLLGAVAQRLVRKLCPACKAPVDIPVDRLVASGYTTAEAKKVHSYGPVGCDACGGSGYRGRIGVFEVMVFDGQLQALFTHEAPVDEMRHMAISRGMRPLRRDALDKVAAGITSLDEVDRVVM